MKTLTSILGFFCLTLVASCQDDTFTKPMKFNAGLTTTIIYFSDGSTMTTTPSGVNLSTVASTGQYNDLLNKPALFNGNYSSLAGIPLTFTPAIHNHDLLYKPITWKPDWTDIQNKPVEKQLMDALPLLNYLPLPSKTTSEINAIVVPAGSIGLVWDKTIGQLKIWNGTIWKAYPTTN